MQINILCQIQCCFSAFLQCLVLFASLHSYSVACCCRSSTHALPAHESGHNGLAKVVVIPEHGPSQETSPAGNVPEGEQAQEGPSSHTPSFQFRRTRRKRAAESILSSIRRHYVTVVDVASYVGLGLVLYAGKGCLPCPVHCAKVVLGCVAAPSEQSFRGANPLSMCTSCAWQAFVDYSSIRRT